MSRARATALLAAALLTAGALAGALAGCGSGNAGTTATAGTTVTGDGEGGGSMATAPVAEPPPNAEEGTVFVSLGSVAGLGQVLVDSAGHTLYAFSRDGAGAPTCGGACAKAWPPLLVESGEPRPSNGTAAARLGTITRADGSRQVTYAGRPLYAFGGDQKPGEATGNGRNAFGGTWTTLRGNGTPAG